MSTLPNEITPARAERVRVTRDALTVRLLDGRTITAPLSWYPRLQNGTAPERNNWQLIASGEGIHWPDLDEDVSIEGLLTGCPSGESPASLEKWLRERSSRGVGKRSRSSKTARSLPSKTRTSARRRG